MDWQPIDTAPRDGVRILVTDARGYVQVGAHANTLRKAQEWRADFQLGRCLHPQPTHWMPLPCPPEKIESGANAAADSPALAKSSHEEAAQGSENHD